MTDHQYNDLERRIARMLSDFPRLKSWIKQAYTRTSYHMAGGRAARMNVKLPLSRIGADDTETFFGYYDKSPLSTNNWLLCHASRHSSVQVPQAGLGLTVQVYDFGTHEFTHPVMSVHTRSYNWQQGARAQWLDGDHFIFNDFDSQQQNYISRVYSVSGRCEVQRYPHAVQDARGRDYFLSINYQRLQALRPEYGYRNLPPLEGPALRSLADDGIQRIEQDSGAARLLYSLQDICNISPQEDFRRARHKVNHLMISPDGGRFIFLHRYFHGGRKYDRLMLGAADGSSLRVLAAHGMVSHCFWADDSTLLCYARGPSGFDGYYQVDIETGDMKSLFDGALDSMGDGHPHVHGDWLVTDSYPDRRRMQHLVKANLRTGAIEELGLFHQSFRFGGETRCDLHPRISLDGKQVFFDSVFEGKRGLYFLEPALNNGHNT